MNEIIETLHAADATLDECKRQLAITQAMESYWKQKHADAWTLIGRIDYALEEIVRAKELRGARRWAAKMRAEIKDRIKT